MHIDAFDQYQEGSSLIHRLDPRTKVVLTILFILSNAFFPDGAWIAFLLSWGFIWLVSYTSGVPYYKYLFPRSFIAVPFALTAVTVVFVMPGDPVLVFHLGSWTLIATETGLARFFSILIRSWLSVQFAVLLVATTPFPDILHAMRHLRVPSLMTVILAFTYRYLLVLSDEALRLIRARDARSARLPARKGGGSILWRAKIVGNVAGQLFLRSLERSDRIYHAMLSRGYQGRFLTMHLHKLSPVDWIAGAVSLIVLLLLQGIARF